MDPVTSTKQRTQAETLQQDYGLSPKGWRDYWVDELARSGRTLEKFHQRGEKVIERYLDERGELGREVRKFNVLWSNVNVLLPAVFTEEPRPIVQRRYLDADPVARVASLMLERVLSYLANSTDEIATATRSAVLDRLLPGLGVTWVRYVDGGLEQPQRPEQSAVTNIPAPARIDERVAVDFVQWKDFRYGVSRSWGEVPWVARRVFMGRKALVARFGPEIGNKVPLNAAPVEVDTDKKDDAPQAPGVGGVFAQAEVWEIWDRRTRSVTWINLVHETPLDTKADPLGFPDFWPCPKPLFATMASDKLVPRADFLFYQDQAIELDSVTQRIAMLTKALKVVGVYDSSQTGIQHMLNEGYDNQLIPVDTWAAFAEKGGIKGVVDFMPLEYIIETLQRLYEVKASLKQDIYEITGLADVIRGASIATETATAQRIKSQFANIRLTDIQRDVQRFLTEQFRMVAHIVKGFFRDETIIQCSGIMQTPDGVASIQAAQQAMTPPPQPQQPGMPPPPPPQPPPASDVIAEAMKLLRDGRLSEFRICVEDAAASEPDITQERQQRTEYLTALTQFLQAAMPAAQTTPQLAPLMASVMMWSLRSFKVGKDIEGQIESALSSLQASAQQGGGEQKPDPEMVKAQAKVAEVEAKVKAAEQKIQLDAQKFQQEMQQDREKHQQEMQQITQKAQIEIQAALAKAQGQIQASHQQMIAGQMREAAANAATGMVPNHEEAEGPEGPENGLD